MLLLLFEYESDKDNLIRFNVYPVIKIIQKKLHEELKNKFKNAFKFYNNDIDKFILLLRKGVYS